MAILSGINLPADLGGLVICARAAGIPVLCEREDLIRIHRRRIQRQRTMRADVVNRLMRIGVTVVLVDVGGRPGGRRVSYVRYRGERRSRRRRSRRKGFGALAQEVAQIRETHQFVKRNPANRNGAWRRLCNVAVAVTTRCGLRHGFDLRWSGHSRTAL